MAGTLHFLEFVLDPANEQLRRGSLTLPLRPKTFAVLRHLAERPGRLVTRDELLDAVWTETAVSESVLSGCINELRQILGDDARRPRVIETAHRRGYRFVAVIAGDVGPPASLPRPDGPFIVGRVAELDELDAWFARAAQRERQVGFVAGEAGIGKTTLVDAFRRRLIADGHVVAHGKCVEHHGGREPYLPVLEALGRLCATPAGGSVLAALRRYAPSWLVQLPTLVDPAEMDALERRLVGTNRERMLREMAQMLEALADPLVLVLEDVQWSDYSTVDLVAELAERTDPAPLLILATYRPVDVVLGAHPLKQVRQALQAHGCSQELWLGPLGAGDVADYLRARCPGLPEADAAARVVFERTDGNALFVKAVVDDLIATGAIVQREARWDLAVAIDRLAVGVPQGLRSLLAAHVERLTDGEREALEAGSVVGRTFSAAVVAGALEGDVVEVEERLESLARHEHMIRTVGQRSTAAVAGRYELTHALYQDVLRERVPPARRRRLHARIATCLERQRGGRTPQDAAVLAFHYEAGGDPERAIPYLEQGAAHASRLGAVREAVALLEHAVALIDALPRTPERTLRTIRLSMAVGAALQSRGFAAPEVERHFARALALSEETDDPVQSFQALIGLSAVHVTRARFDRAREVIERLPAVLARVPVPSFAFGCELLLGMSRFHAGDLAAARAHLEAAVAIEDVRMPDHVTEDLYVIALGYTAAALIYLGFPEQGGARGREAIARADALGSPLQRANAATHACFLWTVLRDVDTLAAEAEQAVALGAEFGFPMSTAVGMVARGRVLSERGDHAAAVPMVEEGIAGYRRSGRAVALPTLLASLVETLRAAGRHDEALAVVAEARAVVDSTREQQFEAELHRLEGELRLVRSERDGAGRCFARALEIARRQGARWWELRATRSAARLHGMNGEGALARRMLAPVVDGFTEGAETPDVRDARALLATLG